MSFFEKKQKNSPEKTEAYLDYKKKAKKGDVAAQFYLGECYYNGTGVKKNYSEAVKCFQKLMESGQELGSANHYMGICYEHGYGVEKDPQKAFMHYSNAVFKYGNCYADYELAKWSAEVTHNHLEGIKGAQAVASAIYLARQGETKEEIETHIENNYYPLDFTLDEIRPDYSFDVTCQGSVPQAIVSFLEATDFEDAIRNAISLGGDGDTIAAMAGSIAEAYYGIPEEIKQRGMAYINKTISYYANRALPFVWCDYL